MALLGRMFSSDAHSYWPGWKISHLDVQILADFFCLPPFEILKSSNWQSQTSEVSSSTHKGRVMCSGQKNTMWTPKLPGCGFQQKWLHTGTFKSWTLFSSASPFPLQWPQEHLAESVGRGFSAASWGRNFHVNSSHSLCIVLWDPSDRKSVV